MAVSFYTSILLFLQTYHTLSITYTIKKASHCCTFRFHARITESWGEFTKWYFLDEYYKELDALYKLHVYDDLYSPWYPKPDDLNIQLWYYNPTKSPYDQCRTPMFIDLWDNCNQSELDENITTATAKYPVDAVNLKVNADISDLAAWSVSCKKVEAVEALSISTVPEQSNNIRTLMTLYKELESTL